MPEIRSFLEKYGISDRIYNISCEAEEELRDRFREIDRVREYNLLKVLSAMKDEGISERHFYGSTGYGYDDIGREALDRIYARVLGTEDGLVRSQLVSGTHTIAVCLFGILRPGDEMLAVTGKPYDTLDEVIGIRPCDGSLAEFGIGYRQVDLGKDGSPDIDKILKNLRPETKLVHIQRSRGYSSRKTLTVDEIGRMSSEIKKVRPDIVVFVDNCYGEFTDVIEPGEAGADICAGSLIKNPGGGLAKTGGYIVGTKKCIDRIANRLTCPGAGRYEGATLGNNRDFIQGLYFAPGIVAESMKGAVFASLLFEKLGFETTPSWKEKRGDIVQTFTLRSPERLERFCAAIQGAAPVDSFVTPEAWDMPGYDSKVIMAAGAFVSGSSIELSADGPMREPYNAYMQGGLSYTNVKIAVMSAASALESLQ